MNWNIYKKAGYHFGLKENVDALMEICFSNIMLGAINTDNRLVELQYNNIKVILKF
ncbi:MAG: hypothetical protein FWB86_03030 [Treponema sp.]|nr:hypothetical protein [Treponema sp.]MCL2251079.1 hypothetical protein [Treponema sp.]MCL2251652.1 hypothetical protein [Treponema sp.]